MRRVAMKMRKTRKTRRMREIFLAPYLVCPDPSSEQHCRDLPASHWVLVCCSELLKELLAAAIQRRDPNGPMERYHNREYDACPAT